MVEHNIYLAEYDWVLQVCHYGVAVGKVVERHDRESVEESFL